MSLTIFSGGAGAAAFDPHSLAGLFAWLKADAITDIADAGAITSWGDVSSNPDIAAVTQATSTKRPTFRTNVLNGKPVVRFDGGDALGSGGGLASLAWPVNFTVFSVAKANAAAADQGICNADNGSGAGRIFKMRMSATALECIGWNTTPTLGSDTEPDANPAAFKVRTLKRGTATMQAYVDGVSAGSSAIAGTNNSGTVALRVGASSVDTGEFLTGDIAEILVYNTALSDTNRDNVEDYLRAKYGL